MRRVLLATFFMAVAMLLQAQNCPQEWRRYTSDLYFHDVESGTDRQATLDRARANLAKQIQVKVKEESTIETVNVNKHASSTFSSVKAFSTDVDMSLAENKSLYDEDQGKYYVIVYINKEEACAYYENEVKMLIGSLDKSIAIAGNYVATGFKSKAKAELEKAVQLFGDAGKPLFWLNVFGLDETRLGRYHATLSAREQTIRQQLADLEYGTTYCVVCDADLFGKRYPKLANELKGELAVLGCNFVENPYQADYVIRVQASARQYNSAYGAFFTYVDAAVTIDKNATSQRIFEDEVSVKGSHTLGYDEAARDGYKKISKEITKLLKENIQK